MCILRWYISAGNWCILVTIRKIHSCFWSCMKLGYYQGMFQQCFGFCYEFCIIWQSSELKEAWHKYCIIPHIIQYCTVFVKGEGVNVGEYSLRISRVINLISIFCPVCFFLSVVLSLLLFLFLLIHFHATVKILSDIHLTISIFITIV